MTLIEVSTHPITCISAGEAGGAQKNTTIPKNRIEIPQIGKNRPPPSLVKLQYHR